MLCHNPNFINNKQKANAWLFSKLGYDLFSFGKMKFLFPILRLKKESNEKNMFEK